jgi:hypothetical protein
MRISLGALCAPSAECACSATVQSATTRHSITSVARSRIEGWMLSPMALAVLRFTMNLNDEACCTGISPGAAPRKILST